MDSRNSWTLYDDDDDSALTSVCRPASNQIKHWREILTPLYNSESEINSALTQHSLTLLFKFLFFSTSLWILSSLLWLLLWACFGTLFFFLPSSFSLCFLSSSSVLFFFFLFFSASSWRSSYNLFAPARSRNLSPRPDFTDLDSLLGKFFLCSCNSCLQHLLWPLEPRSFLNHPVDIHLLGIVIFFSLLPFTHFFSWGLLQFYFSILDPFHQLLPSFRFPTPGRCLWLLHTPSSVWHAPWHASSSSSRRALPLYSWTCRMVFLIVVPQLSLSWWLSIGICHSMEEPQCHRNSGTFGGTLRSMLQCLQEGTTRSSLNCLQQYHGFHHQVFFCVYLVCDLSSCFCFFCRFRPSLPSSFCPGRIWCIQIEPGNRWLLQLQQLQWFQPVLSSVFDTSTSVFGKHLLHIFLNSFWRLYHITWSHIVYHSVVILVADSSIKEGSLCFPVFSSMHWDGVPAGSAVTIAGRTGHQSHMSMPPEFGVLASSRMILRSSHHGPLDNVRKAKLIAPVNEFSLFILNVSMYRCPLQIAALVHIRMLVENWYNLASFIAVLTAASSVHNRNGVWNVSFCLDRIGQIEHVLDIARPKLCQNLFSRIMTRHAEHATSDPFRHRKAVVYPCFHTQVKRLLHLATN